MSEDNGTEDWSCMGLHDTLTTVQAIQYYKTGVIYDVANVHPYAANVVAGGTGAKIWRNGHECVIDWPGQCRLALESTLRPIFITADKAMPSGEAELVGKNEKGDVRKLRILVHV